MSSITVDNLLEKNDLSVRKLPTVRFVRDIYEVLEGDPTGNAPLVMRLYKELLSKFLLMARSLEQQEATLRDRKAHLKRSVEALDTMTTEETRKDGILFKASESVYAKADITDSSKVILMLGADTMCEYSPEEAHKVLSDNCAATEESLIDLEKDLHHLRKQIASTEMCISRLHNVMVSMRQSP